MTATLRFACVAVGIAAGLYVLAKLIGLDPTNDVIVFGFFGVVGAGIGEAIVATRARRTNVPKKDEPAATAPGAKS